MLAYVYRARVGLLEWYLDIFAKVDLCLLLCVAVHPLRLAVDLLVYLVKQRAELSHSGKITGESRAGGEKNRVTAISSYFSTLT